MMFSQLFFLLSLGSFARVDGLSSSAVASANKLKCKESSEAVEPKKTKKWKKCRSSSEKVAECVAAGYEAARKDLVDEDEVLCEYISSTDHTVIHGALLLAASEALVEKWRNKEHFEVLVRESVHEKIRGNMTNATAEALEDLKMETEIRLESESAKKKAELIRRFAMVEDLAVQTMGEVSARRRQIEIRYEDILGYVEDATKSPDKSYVPLSGAQLRAVQLPLPAVLDQLDQILARENDLTPADM